MLQSGFLAPIIDHGHRKHEQAIVNCKQRDLNFACVILLLILRFSPVVLTLQMLTTFFTFFYTNTLAEFYALYH